MAQITIKVHILGPHGKEKRANIEIFRKWIEKSGGTCGKKVGQRFEISFPVDNAQEEDSILPIAEEPIVKTGSPYYSSDNLKV